MRTHGTLIKWNDDRGFGFIDPAGDGVEIFVHVSAFPRDGMRPRIGELISFDLDAGKDGKKKAVRVMRPGTTRRPRRSAAASHRNHPQSSWASIAGVLLLAAILASVYISRRHAMPPVSQQTATLISPSPTPDQLFHCDGRTRCAQMTSCAEATYFLNHCPGTKMDGDHDGVPCQSQWCGGNHEAWP